MQSKQLTKQQILSLKKGDKVRPIDPEKSSSNKNKFILEVTEVNNNFIDFKVINDKNPDYGRLWIKTLEDDGTSVMPRWKTVFYLYNL